jgi:predicted nucleic acid-binding protein
VKVFIDTGAFLALANKSDSLHDLIATVYREAVDQKGR